MPASLTFRLKSSKYIGTIDVEGSVISCREAQEAIATKLSAPSEEIRVFLAGSTAPIHPDEEIPAYAVVDIVRQMPSGRAAPRRGRGNAPSLRGGAAMTMTSFAAPTDRPLTEEERLAQLQAEVTMDTGIDEVGGRPRRGRGGRGGGPPFLSAEDAFKPPPRGYICHNCGKGGHLIQHCPAARGGRGLKLLSQPVGIPESMLVECTMDDPAPKFITRDYRLVKRRLDHSAFTGVPMPHVEEAISPLSRPPMAESATRDGSTEASEEKSSLAAYLCVIDHVPAKEAMKTPCCHKLMCHTCFNGVVEAALTREEAMEDGSPPLLCPGCGEPLLMDEVLPAVEERQALVEQMDTRKRLRD